MIVARANKCVDFRGSLAANVDGRRRDGAAPDDVAYPHPNKNQRRDDPDRARAPHQEACADTRIKRIYEFSTSAWAEFPTTTVTKTLVKDLVPYLEAPGGLLYEKIEGMALMDDGNVYVCNDNDGVDDNSGETQLLNVGGIL